MRRARIQGCRAAAVKARAAGLGFDACGIAAAGPVDPKRRLDAWLANGRHADMHWIAAAKDVRSDVRLKVPDARSVVVVARNYYAERPRPAEGCGTVSRYAWGRDYHRVLRKPLRELARLLAGMGDAEPYCCVDTGPVLERAWAAKAGVGWIGKNGLVIREGLGSWFFLGVIVTTVELPADAPAANRCGTCTECMEACPAGAIVEPGVVDARRCISYNTVENRGDIPGDVRGCMGSAVFGCDACQEACPWNRAVPETTERGFYPRVGQANPSLAELADMDEDTFNERFAGTPLRRAKHAGIQRNVRIAIENLHNLGNCEL